MIKNTAPLETLWAKFEDMQKFRLKNGKPICDFLVTTTYQLNLVEITIAAKGFQSFARQPTGNVWNATDRDNNKFTVSFANNFEQQIELVWAVVERAAAAN
jgi:hypothetical protein